jgi:ComEC/Rec2-related protein
MIRQGIHYSLQLRDNWSYILKTDIPLRTKIRDSLIALNEKLYDKKTSGVINALMLGDSYFVDKHITYDFTRAGVLHILAASGTHIVIIAAIPLFLFSLLKIPSSLSYTATSLMLAAYYYLTCMPVSLLRACVMFWIITLCKLLKKKNDTLNALYFSASVILLLHPYELFALGFQLSYGATFGVIVFQKRFRRALPNLPFRISDSLAMTFSAQVAVLPILCASIGDLNFTGIVSNIFLIPGTGLVFLASIIIDFLTLIIPVAGSTAAHAVTNFMQFNLSAAHILARLPGHFPAPNAPFWLIIPYAFLCIPILMRKLPTWKAGSCITASILCIFIPLMLMTSSPAQQISIIAKAEKRVLVTKGDSALIYGSVRSKKECDDIKKTLRKRGYCSASLYICDFSSDSLRETAALIRSMPVETVIISANMPLDSRSIPLLDALEIDGIRPVFEREPHLKNDCQYAAKVYEMKCFCESVLNDNDSS